MVATTLTIELLSMLNDVTVSVYIESCDSVVDGNVSQMCPVMHRPCRGIRHRLSHVRRSRTAECCYWPECGRWLAGKMIYLGGAGDGDCKRITTATSHSEIPYLYLSENAFQWCKCLCQPVPIWNTLLCYRGLCQKLATWYKFQHFRSLWPWQ